MRIHGLLDPDTMNTHLFATCGDWDLKTMLPNQLELAKVRHGLDGQGRVIAPYNRWINIKKPFKKYTDKPGKASLGMKAMLRHFELDLLGRHHSGIDDTKNILRIIEKMLAKGWDPSTGPISGVAPSF